MSTKFVIVSSTTAGDRLLNVQQAAIHLSDGSLAMLVYDPAATAPNKVTLQLVPGSAHTTPQTIATLSTDVAAGTANWVIAGYALSLALCRDSADNLYVVGTDNTTGDLDNVGVQAFVKAAGALRWTPAPYVNHQCSATEDFSLASYATVWCDTGGGTNAKGHLHVIADDTNGGTYSLILDAGAILQGKGSAGSGTTFIKSGVRNPSFLGGSRATALVGGNFDISADGFGASHGIAIMGDTTAAVDVGSWAVTSGGALTGGGLNVAVYTTGTLGATTKVRAVSYGPGSGLWVVAYRSSANTTQLTVRVIGATTGGSVDTGTASNFPAMGATLSWGISAAAPADSRVWVFGWSSATANTMLRLPITMTGAGVPSLGAVVTDDTAVGTTPTTIRVVKEPVDIAHTDYQAYDSVTPFRLLGDFSGITTSPSAPTLLSPANSTVAALAGGGTFTWQDIMVMLGDFAGNHYFRRQIAGGAYEYWNGSAWTGSVTSTSSGAAFITFGAGLWVAGATYTWWVQTYGQISAQLSPWSQGFTVVVANPAPATPTLTASYDAPTNTGTLTLHSSDATGPTGSIEYSDDGGATWDFVRNATALTINPGTATVLDREAPSGGTRQYRARSWTAYPTSYSAYATASVGPVITAFWLRDPVAGTAGVQLKVRRGTFKTQRPEPLTKHQGLGNPAPIVVSDVLGLEGGQATVWTQSATDEPAFLALLNAQKTLLLQAPDGRQWYIRITSPRPTDTPYLVRTGTYREHAITFDGQAKP